VIIEYEIDSACIAGKVKIIQNLGSEYDKEALRVANLIVSLINKCNFKCKYVICDKRKVKLPINFVKPNDDD
jgi:hypothetical protein